MFHCSFEEVKIEDLFGPDIVSDVVVNICEVSNVGVSLFLSPFFIDSFAQLFEGFLETFKVIIVDREHKFQVPLPFVCVSVVVVFIHKFRSWLSWLWLLEVYFSYLTWLSLLSLCHVISLLWVIIKVLIMGMGRKFGIVRVMVRLHATIQNIIIKILYSPSSFPL